METNYTLKVTPANKPGKIVANVKVTFGPLWASFTLEKNGDKHFLNAPAKFIPSLKGKEMSGGAPHSGYIEQAGLTKEFWAEIRDKALAALN